MKSIFVVIAILCIVYLFFIECRKFYMEKKLSLGFISCHYLSFSRFFFLFVGCRVVVEAHYSFLGKGILQFCMPNSMEENL